MSPSRAILVIGLLLTSCMLSPENGEDIGSDGMVSFWGQGTTPGQVFNIQSSAHAAGPFATLASVSTEDTATTLGGVSVYAWRADAAIPLWNDLGGCHQEAFVRATTGTYFALTFDEGNGAICILDKHFGEGTNIYNAALECQSSDSPVARVTRTEHSTHTGDVVLSTQAQADAFACVGTIEGSLTILDNPAELSIALPSLDTVTGDVDLVYSRDPASPSSNPVVRSIDMPQLTTIGGNVLATYPGQSNDISQLDLHLEGVTSVGGDVTVTASGFNLDLKGLDNLAAIPGDLSVSGPGGDYTAYGWLESLTSVGGDLSLQAGSTSVGLWTSLETVGGNLSLSEMFLPPGTTNFAALETVEGDVSLVNVGAATATQLDGQLPNLFDIGGTLKLHNVFGLSWLDVGDVDGSLDVGALELNNTGLADLEPTHLVVGDTGTISVVGHSNLTTCEVDAFAATQAAFGWTGTLVNLANAGC